MTTKRASRSKGGVRAERVDPPDPTEEEVQEAQELMRLQREFQDAYRDEPYKWAAGPLHQRYAEPLLEEDRKKFEAGNRMALFGAIRICANHGLPLPRWAATAFILGYDEVLNCRVGSWDLAFGKPYPKGEHLKSRWRRRNYGLAVRFKADEMHRKGIPKDEAMFEEIGNELGIGKTLAMEFYYGKRNRNSGKR